MKRIFFIAIAALAICSSCSDSYYLPETEQELAQLDKEYETVKYHEEKFKGEDDQEKIETSADEVKLRASMDEYVTELMNRSSIAKERVMRTVYSSTIPVVGVFKISTCGSNKEMKLVIDCEDSSENSGTSGSIGASHVDGSGNVNFMFCLTNANRYYPGGVFLVDHINYNMGLTQGSSGRVRQIDAFVRHHDAEDSNPSHSMICGHPDYQLTSDLGGYTKIDRDATLAWGFPPYPSQFDLGTYYGPGGIDYGLLSTTIAATGTIYFDDEDNHNANWIQRYKLGTTLDGSFTADTALREYGITANKNTRYSVSLSTDTKFSKNNIYYAARLIFQ